MALALVLGLGAAAAAVPLQEIVKGASPSIAHLSIRDAQGEEESSGSGFVISEEGWLATNFHVAEGAERAHPHRERRAAGIPVGPVRGPLEAAQSRRTRSGRGARKYLELESGGGYSCCQ